MSFPPEIMIPTTQPMPPAGSRRVYQPWYLRCLMGRIASIIRQQFHHPTLILYNSNSTVIKDDGRWTMDDIVHRPWSIVHRPPLRRRLLLIHLVPAPLAALRAAPELPTGSGRLVHDAACLPHRALVAAGRAADHPRPGFGLHFRGPVRRHE